MFLQEPRLKEAKAGQLERACNWPNSKVQGEFTSNQEGNGGVATIVKKSFLELATGYVVHEMAPDECQHVTFSIEGTQFSFANVYMSSHEGPRRATLCKTLQERLPIKAHSTCASLSLSMTPDMGGREEPV